MLEVKQKMEYNSKEYRDKQHQKNNTKNISIVLERDVIDMLTIVSDYYNASKTHIIIKALEEYFK